MEVGATSSTSANSRYYVQLGDRLEFWVSPDITRPHFISIAALYTELVAITDTGELHQWKWKSSEPYNLQVNMHDFVTRVYSIA